MRTTSAAIAFAALVALGVAACVAESSQPPAVAVPAASASSASEDSDTPAPSGYAILAALSGSAVPAGVFVIADSPSADTPAPSPSTAASPPAGRKALSCTCQPAAFVLTPKQRATLDRVREMAGKLEASGQASTASKLRERVDGLEKAMLAQCVQWCATQ